MLNPLALSPAFKLDTMSSGEMLAAVAHEDIIQPHVSSLPGEFGQRDRPKKIHAVKQISDLLCENPCHVINHALNKLWVCYAFKLLVRYAFKLLAYLAKIGGAKAKWLSNFREISYCWPSSSGKSSVVSQTEFLSLHYPLFLRADASWFVPKCTTFKPVTSIWNSLTHS